MDETRNPRRRFLAHAWVEVDCFSVLGNRRLVRPEWIEVTGVPISNYDLVRSPREGVAEGVGFEPTVGFKPTLDFESSALNRTQPPFPKRTV